MQQKSEPFPILRIGASTKRLDERVTLESHIAEFAKDIYVEKKELEQQQKDIKENFHLINEVTCIDEGVYLIPHHSTKHTINKNLYKKASGEYILDDFAHELSLVFKKDDELIVLNSCSHVGMQSVIDEVSRLFKDKKVKVYLGGLHMKGRHQGKEVCVYNDEQINEICEVIYDNNIVVYTGHCTGEIAFDKLKEECHDLIYSLYSGLSIEI